MPDSTSGRDSILESLALPGQDAQDRQDALDNQLLVGRMDVGPVAGIDGHGQSGFRIIHRNAPLRFAYI